MAVPFLMLRKSVANEAMICYTYNNILMLEEVFMRRSYCVRNKVFIMIALILLITSSLSSCMAEDKKEAKRNLFDALENNDRQAVSDILDEYPKLVNEDYYT